MELSSYKFIIIDNDPSSIAHCYKVLPRIGVSDEHIWPPKTTSFLPHSWIEVSTKLDELRRTGWDPTSGKVILLLDLALDGSDERPSDGVEAIKGRQSFLEDYVLVVHTRMPNQTGLDQLSFLDATLAKRVFESTSTRDAVVSASIRKAIASRAKRFGEVLRSVPSEYCVIEDDFRLRLFEREYGLFALPDLLDTVGAKITNRTLEKPKVKIASGGYSGTTVLLIEYDDSEGHRRVAVKISKNKEALASEDEQIKKLMQAGRIWASCSLTVLPMQSLSADSSIHLLMQHYFAGDTLEVRCLARSHERLGELADVVGALQRVSSESLRQSRKMCTLDALSLSSDNVFRFNSSFERLIKLWESGSLPTEVKARFAHLAEGIKDLRIIANNWNAHLLKAHSGGLVGYEQHGDMNPRNILLSVDKDTPGVRFIDFARFRVWPAFYDLWRLRLQLALRLLDSPDEMQDLFPERMVLWDRAWRGDGLVVNECSSASTAGFQSFLTIQSELLVALQKLHNGASQEDRDNFVLAERTIIIFDLIKMISYVDASPFKQLWFLLLAAEQTGSTA